MDVPFRQPKTIDGELFFTFSVEELEKNAEPFHYSMVLKLLRQQPSLDSIRAFIHCHWGLSSMPIVSTMRKPRHVFIQLSNESDFNKSFSRELCEVNGVSYRAFAWTIDFDEDFESSRVLSWVFLLGLPPNFYH